MRTPKLKKFKSTWLTKEAYCLLRKAKRDLVEKNQGKSMMEIINDLIIKEYGNN